MPKNALTIQVDDNGQPHRLIVYSEYKTGSIASLLERTAHIYAGLPIFFEVGNHANVVDVLIKRKYHGWIVRRSAAGLNDTFVAEYSTENGRVRHTFSSPAEAIEFWEKRLNASIKLQDTPLGSYRVYTEQ